FPLGLFPLLDRSVPLVCLPPLSPPVKVPLPLPALLVLGIPSWVLLLLMSPPMPPFSPCRGGLGTPVPSPLFCFGIVNSLLEITFCADSYSQRPCRVSHLIQIGRPFQQAGRWTDIFIIA